MQLYELQVSKTAIYAAAPVKIPQRILGAVIRIRFSPEWENLKKTVVFRAGDITKDILNVEEFAVIPAECTQELGQLLEVGVYGVDGENTVAIPTVWAAIGRITEATDPSGDASTDPTLPVWAQLQERIRFLEETGVSQGQLEKAVEYYLLANPFTADDVGLGNLDNERQYSASNPPPYPVTSVNGNTGAVVLDAADVGAAPAGYGLGGTDYVTPNEALKAGFYNTWLEVAGYSGHATLEVINREDSIITQTAHTAYGNILHRVYYQDAWGEWEWENPPVQLGVEYRTTKKYNGKPVYLKYLNCGSGPNNTEKKVGHGASDAIVFNYGGYMYQNGGALSIPWSGYSEIFASSTDIVIKTTANYSAYTAYAWIEYYKTTD